MECGAELPERGSFCPECGAETNPDENSTSSKSDEQSQEELLREAEILNDKSKGGFYPKIITQTKSPNKILDGMRSDGPNMLYDDPIISYFKEDEQPHYLMYNSFEGIKITEPSGNEKRPHHNKGRYKFLIPTDDRIIYLAACEGEDKLREFSYLKIEKAGMTNRNNASRKAGLATPKIGFHTTDGYKYEFVDRSLSLYTKWEIDAVAEYIKERANAKDVDLAKRLEDKAEDLFSL